MLKNENQTLPLEFPENGTLAVIGPSAKVTQFQGGGSSQVTPHYMVSPLEAIHAYGAENDILVEYSEGAPIYRQPPVIPASVIRSSDGQGGILLAGFFDNLNFEYVVEFVFC